MPLYVLERNFPRSGLGDNFQILCSLPLTILVGVNCGRLCSHRHVALVSPCPYCHGCIICVGFLYFVDIIPMEFSIAQGQDRWVNSIKKSIDACCDPFALFSANHLAPLDARSVQGGKAITRSQSCASSGSTSPCICLLRTAAAGWLDDCKSQLVTLCPLANKRLDTAPLSSQATRIFIIGYPIIGKGLGQWIALGHCVCVLVNADNNRYISKAI